MNLNETSLPAKVQAALAAHGIETVEMLLNGKLDDFKAVPGIGPKALLQIADVRDGAFQEMRKADMAAEAKPKSKTPVTRVPTHRTYTVKLQNRHADWIDAYARLTGLEPGGVIEWCVRQKYFDDPEKAGLRDSPDIRQVGGKTVRADENPFRGDNQ
jgi:hypothetical protein